MILNWTRKAAFEAENLEGESDFVRNPRKLTTEDTEGIASQQIC